MCNIVFAQIELTKTNCNFTNFRNSPIMAVRANTSMPRPAKRGRHGQFVSITRLGHASHARSHTGRHCQRAGVGQHQSRGVGKSQCLAFGCAHARTLRCTIAQQRCKLGQHAHTRFGTQPAPHHAQFDDRQTRQHSAAAARVIGTAIPCAGQQPAHRSPSHGQAFA